MPAEIAARIVALRPCIEALLVAVCNNPESTACPSELDGKLLQVLHALATPSERKFC